MQPVNRGQTATPLEERLRLMRIIWAMFLVSVGAYAVAGYVSDPPTEVEMRGAGVEGPGWLLPISVILGAAAVLASIVAGRAYAHKAAAGRRPELLQTGLIIALALCEAATMLGLVSLFLTGDRYSYVLFAVGAVGMLLHFPRRERLLAASPRSLG